MLILVNRYYLTNFIKKYYYQILTYLFLGVLMKNKKIVLIIITLVLVFVLGFLFKINSYQELKIAQISDIHIWADKNEDGTPTFPELLLYDAIEQINEENSLDFTLITGDLMDIPDVNLFHHVVKIFNNLKKPWYYAIGNHDRNFMHQLEREPLLEILQQENHNGLPYGRYYTFEPKKNYKFIALDGSDYGIDQEQINYLVAELRNSGDKFVVIYLHTPLKLLEELPGHYAWNSEKVISV